jgi:type VI secretion system protein ImpG
MTFAELGLDQLRFFLHGEGSLAYDLYELLFNDVCEIQLCPGDKEKPLAPIKMAPSAVRPVGFEPDEGVFPYRARSFLGYRLLQEYFSFPEKFLFVDLFGLQRGVRAKMGERIEVVIFLTHSPQLEQPINEATFRLGCTPIINLFKHVAEPIRLSHAQTEYRVVPDFRRQNAMEVYSIDAVTSISPSLQDPLHFQPFYSFKHTSESEQQKAFWYAARGPSPKKGDSGTEVDITLVDLNFRPTLPAVDTLTVHTTCLNRDLPGKLPFGGERGDLELEGAAPVTRVRCLFKPTETVRPPLGQGLQWRLISHLSLNYLSVCAEGREAFQEILQLYNFSDSSAIQNQIGGIIDLSSRKVVRRPASMPWNGFCRGLEVTIEFDEEKYVGSGVYLFASVLEKFLGLYTSLNSFTQLVAKCRQREEPLKRWPPRAGERILL